MNYMLQKENYFYPIRFSHVRYYKIIQWQTTEIKIENNQTYMLLMNRKSVKICVKIQKHIYYIINHVLPQGTRLLERYESCYKLIENLNSTLSLIPSFCLIMEMLIWVIVIISFLVTILMLTVGTNIKYKLWLQQIGLRDPVKYISRNSV